ncbi:MAG: 3-isopropylmalate dehydrogenase [Deltaproteobacteria bacterium]|nr:3-isopropylmalate dehydrogenase [Deltaproteobacteria bacterium]HCH63902.1 3-isopropylmalate dehydrogenase [Deltaproteobacteria bacterium]
MQKRSPRIAVVPGDGIGVEVIAEGVRVLKHLAPDLELEHFDLGADRYLRDGVTLPDDVFMRWRDEFDAIFLGALGDPRVPSNVHAKEILLGSRFRYDLYINQRPIRLLDARKCPLKGKGPSDVDIMVFRENTEGLYTAVGGVLKKDTPDEVAQEACVVTRKGVERIIRAAFEWADANGKRRVCMSDKSNAMRNVGQLWQKVFRIVAAEYPHIEASHLYVDVLAMELVRAPERFEVIVTGNLFGDIITDLGAILQGGIGLACSGNIHPGQLGLFEPVHGSAPDIAGQGKANPMATFLTAGMMLANLGRPELEVRIIEAVRVLLLADQTTPELGGTLTTSQVTDALLEQLG